MPLKKRSRVSNDCKQRCNSARKRLKRENKTEEERALRLDRIRISTTTIRSNETEEERALRPDRIRISTTTIRSN